MVVGDPPEENVASTEEAVNTEATTEAAASETVVTEPTSSSTTTSVETTDKATEETPQSPVEIPAELATPTTEPTVFTDVERQELAQLRQVRAEMAQFRTDQQSELELRQFQADYETRGFDSDTAKYIAQEVRAERLRGTQGIAQAQQTAQIEKGRQNAAAHYGKQYGVAPSALVGFSSPQEMEKYAQLLSYTGKMDKRVKAVEEKQVEEQAFDQGQGVTGKPRSAIDLLAYYGNNQDVEISAADKKTMEDAGFG
jgi:hypothetical protein